MLPSEIITEARYLINDTASAAYRQSDTEMLLYVNEGIREASLLQPALFSTIGDLTCTPGTCEHSITFTDAVSLIEVLAIHNGRALTVFDIKTMDAFNPNWRTDTAASATQWARFPNDVLKFFIYPKAPATVQTIDVRYVRNPTTYATGDSITDLPLAVQPALVNYVVYRAEMKDDEHVLSGRAVAAYQAFQALLKG